MTGGDGLQSGNGDPLVGRLVDKYRIAAPIGRGGMGRVYRALQENLGREVALKVLHVTKATEPEFVRRFEKEAAVCARLTHPNTIRIYDHGTTGDGLPWIAMELLHGRSLHQVLREEAPLVPRRAIRLLKPVCGSVAEAHSHNLVHRDLKPGNIILTEHGDDVAFPKVLDFGLVKDLDLEVDVTASGLLLGSPLYMSPEQIKGEKVDARTDVYALGTILYVMLVGEPPFGQGAAVTLLMSHVSEPVPPMKEKNPKVEVPASLEWVVRTCLAKEADDRFANARELARALKICELEIIGEVESPVTLALDHGLLVLPEGLDEPSVTGLRAPLIDLPESTTEPTLAEARVAPARGGSWTLAVAVIALLLAVLVGGLAYTARWQVANRASSGAEGMPLPEPVPAEAKEGPALRFVQVTTDPPGAHVQREGVFLGDAPVRLVIPLGERWIIDVGREGYRSRAITLDGSQNTVRVSLQAGGSSDSAPPEAAPAPAIPSREVPPPEAQSPVESEGDWTPESDVRDPWAE